MLMVIGISLPINTCCLIQHLKALKAIERQFSLHARCATGRTNVMGSASIYETMRGKNKENAVLVR